MKGGARNNKPAALRALHRSKIRPRHRREILACPVGALEPPPGLTSVEEGLWAYYMPRLASVKVLTELDREALLNFCRCAAQVDEIRAQQQQPTYRRLIKTRTHALDSQLRQWLQLTRLAAAELGLSPVSRARVLPVAPAQDRDDLESFIQAPLRRVR